LLVAAVCVNGVCFAAWAEEDPLVGYVAMNIGTQNSVPAVSDEWQIPLMQDPQAEEPPEPTAIPANETAGNVEKTTRTLMRIAVVPHDYKGRYGETAFDSRLGNPDCNLKGVYAQCVYTRTQDY